MYSRLAVTFVALLSLLFSTILFAQARAQTRPSESSHKVAIHVDDNDPKVMNLALNNARNVLEYYRKKGEKVVIEIVTYGPGLHMLRADTSPVKQRIAEMSLAASELSFSACANTRAGMSKQEGKEVPLLSEARVVPSGVVRLIDLQEKGYAYIRPSGR
jgi:uncharacterized protein